MDKKTIHNKNEAMEFLKEYLAASNRKLKIGIAGSFVRDEQTAESDRCPSAVFTLCFGSWLLNISSSSWIINAGSMEVECV